MKKLVFNKNHGKWFLSKIIGLIESHNLFEKEENIGFALSGGVDSVTLLYILAYLNRFSHYKFDITAVHIKSFDYDTDVLKKLCYNLGVEYNETQIDLTDFKKNVCYYCSRERRKKIKEILGDKGIEKVVFAHNKNDVLETFFMNLALHKRIETIQPKSCSADFCVVRPMLDLDKKTILALHKYFDLPVLEYYCRFQKENIRKEFRKFIKNTTDNKIMELMLKNITKAFYRK